MSNAGYLKEIENLKWQFMDLYPKRMCAVYSKREVIQIVDWLKDILDKDDKFMIYLNMEGKMPKLYLGPTHKKIRENVINSLTM